MCDITFDDPVGGREGAALQLGGSAASFLAKRFGLKESNRKILVTAGMSSVFAGLFGSVISIRKYLKV